MPTYAFNCLGLSNRVKSPNSAMSNAAVNSPIPGKLIDKKGIPFEVSLEVLETDTSLEGLKKHRSESFDSLETLIDEVKSDE